MPSPAPESIRLCPANTRIKISRALIIHLEIRSRPLCSPKLHTTNPTTTVMAIQKAISGAEPSRLPNTPATASALIPGWKVPVANFTR